MRKLLATIVLGVMPMACTPTAYADTATECLEIMPQAKVIMDFRLEGLPFQVYGDIVIKDPDLTPKQRWILIQLARLGYESDIDGEFLFNWGFTVMYNCLTHYGKGEATLNPDPNKLLSQDDYQREEL